MTIAVDTHLSSSTLCMINDPDASTAYSLSGHVSVSLSSSASFFDKARTEKVLLRSLTLIFEGQSELVTNETGYSAARLCRLTRELAPTQAMLLSNDGHEDSDVPSVWNFVFDLPVPGWLPSSSIYGSDVHGPAGTSYALFAEARFTPLEEGLHPRAWSFSTLCVPFISRIKTVRAPRAEVEVVRFMSPTMVDELEPYAVFPEALYMINTRNNINKRANSSPRILENVFSKIELRVSVPEYVDMDAGSFILTLRLRAGALSMDQQQRLRLTHFRMQLSQQEVYSQKPSCSYTSVFPLPFSQPDSKPLLNTHPVKALYDIGLSSVNFPDGVASRIRASFSLLPQKQLGRHILPGGGISLEQEAVPANEQVWTRVDVSVPFERVALGQDVAWEQQHGRVKALRADEEGPLFRVHHELEIELTCAYGTEGGDDISSVEHMGFSIPVKFARLPPTKSRASSLFGYSAGSATRDGNTVVLPAYSQLFHANGERRIDDSVPLPVYTPRESPEATQSMPSADKLWPAF